MSEAVQAMVHPSGVLHDAEFVTTAGLRVYTTTYSPKADTKGFVLLCPSWGMEARHQLDWSHRFAHDVAVRGATAVVMQWPGTEDSEGDPYDVTLDRLVETGSDVAGVLRARVDTSRCCIVGMRLGAAPAALIATATHSSHLALVQPVLDLAEHFDELEHRVRRSRLGVDVPVDWAFGHPLPRGLRGADDHQRVIDALGAFDGRGVVVRYRRPADQPVPGSLRSVRVWGEWTRTANIEHDGLRAAATRWIGKSMRGRG